MFWDKYCPTETTFILKDGEEDTPYYWKMRAPTFKVEEQVARKLRSMENPDVFDIATTEIAATFAGSNFPAGNSPTSDPNSSDYIKALSEDASEQEIREFLGTMPSQIVFEIWRKIEEVAPNWGPDFRRNTKA